MSEQIREQVSTFLDGELPPSETELLLKRLMRDGELREHFGRYALIGEALRGTSHENLTHGFCRRVNASIDGGPGGPSSGELVPATTAPGRSRPAPWWRPLSGVAIAAGVAAVAVVALQQRAEVPAVRVASQAHLAPLVAPLTVHPDEALSYTVPAGGTGPAMLQPAARLTNYVFAHSQYSSGLGQRGVLADMLIEDEESNTHPVP